MTQEKSILAGGCFWGMQDLVRKRDGVISTRVGYSGGDVPNAMYPHHGTHAEAIEIIFDPDRFSFRGLLELFMTRRRAIARATTQEPLIALPSSRPVTNKDALPRTRSPMSMHHACGPGKW